MSDPADLPHDMRAWRVHAFGPDPKAALRLEEVAVPEPGPGELLVRVQAAPLNLNDLDRVTGQNMMAPPTLPAVPGMEVLGVVVAAGEGAGDRLGTRVVAMSKTAVGGFAEYAICPSVSAFPMPEDVPLPGAAALYFPFHLAWLGLVDRAKLGAGESVLVHAGAGGAGSAAIQLAKHLGARVIATAGGEAKVALCRELGADVALDYTQGTFQPAVLEATGGRGVDVVFDGVGEAVMEESLRCTAYDGRYLMMGFASDKRFADEKLIVPRRISTGNLQLCGVLLAYADPAMAGAMKQAMGWNFVPAERGRTIMAEIVELARAGRIAPVVGSTVGFEALPDALVALRDRATTGRTIVEIQTP